MASIIHNKIREYSKEEIADAYNAIFNSPKGRIVLLHLASLCHLDCSTFSPEPLTMARAEGERRVILEILERMNTNILNLMTDIDFNGTLQLEEKDNESII